MCSRMTDQDPINVAKYSSSNKVIIANEMKLMKPTIKTVVSFKETPFKKHLLKRHLAYDDQ